MTEYSVVISAIETWQYLMTIDTYVAIIQPDIVHVALGPGSRNVQLELVS